VKRVGLILGILILWTGLATAGTVGMSFTGLSGSQGSNNSLDGVYTYPYYFSITANGNTYNQVPLICDDFSDEVWVGESWTANEYSLSSIVSGANQGLFGDGLQYKQAAYYFSEILSHDSDTTDVAELNWLIWGLMNPSIDGNSNYTSTVSDLSGKGLLLPSGPGLNVALSHFNDSNFVVYVPVNQGSGRPQEYLGYNGSGNGAPGPLPTPEPASLALLASGLVGLAVKKCRK
jgi:PEP-CTERM motif